MNFRSFADLHRLITLNLQRARAARPDLVVGIPRSGMLAATPLALLLDVPLADIHSFCEGRMGQRNTGRDTSNVKRVLLVDDSTNSGKAMSNAVRAVHRARPDVQVTRFAVFAKPERPESVDVFLENVPGPRIFQWNFWRNEKIARFAFDIDGVLCRDPTKDENDDGPRYEQFIATVPPWYLPKRPVGWLVTCRLEKYRVLTEAWLQKHGVQYGKLIMLDLPSKAARLEQKPAVPFKAQAYRETGARLFVESCHKKANGIAKATGWPVLSIEGMELVQP